MSAILQSQIKSVDPDFDICIFTNITPALGQNFRSRRPRNPSAHHLDSGPSTYILKMPKPPGGVGRLRAIFKEWASTRRVSAGVMMPSSHSRAVA